MLLALASVMVAATMATAHADAQRPERLAQVQMPPVPPGPPPAAPAAQASDSSIGTVASLQGGASVTRNNVATALKISDPLFAGDVLQTESDGTLDVTFDDDTTFTLKPNSRIAVDDFVYQQGGASNAARFDVVLGTVAFIASQVAHTGDMSIETPTATLGIRGTTGVIEIPQGPGEADIKLYADANGNIGRIEIFGRDGTQLGILSRAATGFAVRAAAPGAPQRFTAVPLQISAAEAARDRGFVRQTFFAQALGRQINIQRRNLRQQRRNQLRPNQRGGRPGQPLRGGRSLQQRRPGAVPPGRQRYPGQRRGQYR